MAAQSDIVIGIIGAGGNTRLRHIPELQTLAEKGARVWIKSVANRSKRSAAEVAAQFDIPVATDDWRDVIEDPEINAVLIGTWPYMHSQLTIAALEAGKHVLCEARMAMNATEAREMLHAARKNPHLVAQLVPSPPTLPFDATIQQIVRSGNLGRLTAISVRGVTGQFADELGSPLSWRQDDRYSGLNILSMGICYEALHRWVGGATRVIAMSKVVCNMRTDKETGAARAVTVPDHVDVIADMACGAQARMVFSAVCGAAAPPVHEFWLHGTDGTLRLDVDDGRLEVALRSEGGRLQEVDVEPALRGFWRVEEEWLNAIRGLEQVRLTDFEAGVRYMEFTEAVARSCQEGRAVGLPLLDARKPWLRPEGGGGAPPAT